MTEKELYNYVIQKAVDYGMKPKYIPQIKEFNGIQVDDNGNAIVRHSRQKGAYIGLIDPGQPIVEDEFESDGINDTSGGYTGLSFVVFTQCNAQAKADDDKSKKKTAMEKASKAKQDYCIVSIGIGSSSLGDDLDLASKPGFRRSFMNLVNKTQDEEVDYHFVENWAAMESRCPGLKDRVDEIEKKGGKPDNSGPLHCSIEKYDKPKLLPAACVIKLPEKADKGIPALDAWLAKYAQWRGWMSKSNLPSDLGKLLQQKRRPAKTQEVIEAEISSILEEHKYIVLQGAPGCGKTWSANNIASSKDLKTKKPKYSKVFFTQFHAETTYADFVYGIKPILGTGTGLGYEGKKGTLLDAIDYAARNNAENVLLIIDEINRANLANVLGPVFYLFEPNAKERNHELYLGQVTGLSACDMKVKNGKEEMTIYTVDVNGDIKCKALPTNLYVIATMNTADKSLAVVDFALRRRFAWYTLYPCQLDDKKLNGRHFNAKLFEQIRTLFKSYATDEELNLQPGHSYFITDAKEESKGLNDEMKHRLVYEIMPLMKEYFAEGYLQEAKNEFAQLYYSYTNEYMYK